MHPTSNTTQAQIVVTVLNVWSLMALMSPMMGCGGCARSTHPSLPPPPQTTTHSPHPITSPTPNEATPEPCEGQPCGASSLPAQMAYPDRYLHTATALPRNQMMVVGGYTRDDQRRGALTSTLLLDLSHHRRLAAPPITYARWGHTTTLLSDGSLLVVGGSMDDPEHSPFRQAPPEQLSWASDPIWHERVPPWKGRLRHTATLLPNGSVLIIGGAASYEQALRTPERYDPDTQTWTRLAPDHIPRYDHTATLLPDGSVLVVGGRHGTGCGQDCVIDCLEDIDCGSGAVCADEFFCTQPLNHAALYFPDTNTWTSVPPLPQARYDHTATLLPNGSVLVAGGRNDSEALAQVLLYDPTLRTWTSTAPMADARSGHTALLYNDGSVWVQGGRAPTAAKACDDGNPCPSDHLYRILASVETYTPTTRTWTTATPLNRARYDHTATLLSTGEMVVWGGAHHQRASVLGGERLEPQQPQWTVVPFTGMALGGSP